MPLFALPGLRNYGRVPRDPPRIGMNRIYPCSEFYQSLRGYNLQSVFPDRISELLKPFLSESAALSETQLQHISTYIDMLLRWNARINLTAVREPEEIVTRHFGESLFAARHLFPSQSAWSHPPSADDQLSTTNNPVHVLDLGSGAGFPGLPIKIWAPRIHVTLIESNQKKATFLREVARRVILMHIDVFSARAETFLGQADVVTLRAVERFESILPIAIRMVAPKGRLALLIGESQVALARSLAPALSWSEPMPIPLSIARVLLIGTANEPAQLIQNDNGQVSTKS